MHYATVVSRGTRIVTALPARLGVRAPDQSVAAQEPTNTSYLLAAGTSCILVVLQQGDESH
jgi:hypothetical protein